VFEELIFMKKSTKYGFKIILLFLFLTACATAQETGKSTVKNNSIPVENQVVVNKGVNYEDYLVDIKSYSTNGGYYQTKYKKEIISILKNLSDKEGLQIVRSSAGFYYDKKSKKTDMLFFGFDTSLKKENNLDYGTFALEVIRENLPAILEEIFKYGFVQSESEIVGVVIGFRWYDAGDEVVNIWIKKEDVLLFLDERLTANEMYQRGTVTNSSGRVILLPI